MIVRTDDLTPEQLDIVIARIERNEILTVISDTVFINYCHETIPFRPTKNWIVGGPLIEKYGVGFLPCYAEKQFVGQPHIGKFFNAFIPNKDLEGTNKSSSNFGKTHLIAAMRAIVRAERGDEVVILDEWCQK